MDLLVAEARAEIGPRHAVARVRAARPVGEQVVTGERRADRPTGVARRRLDPDRIEDLLLEQLPVGHAVERDAAGHAQIARLRFLVQRAPELDDRVLGHRLDGGGDVHVELGEQLLRTPRRLAE